VALGTVSTIFMLPFVLYELALGYSCRNLYVWPVVFCVLSKLIGETLCFFIGRALEPKLRPTLSDFKIFKAIESMTKSNPMRVSILLRVSMVTP
jgi:uncharacterized membrane protein YdjX (TVP38/TMEM64 family)